MSCCNINGNFASLIYVCDISVVITFPYIQGCCCHASSFNKVVNIHVYHSTCALCSPYSACSCVSLYNSDVGVAKVKQVGLLSLLSKLPYNKNGCYVNAPSTLHAACWFQCVICCKGRRVYMKCRV